MQTSADPGGRTASAVGIARQGAAQGGEMTNKAGRRGHPRLNLLIVVPLLLLVLVEGDAITRGLAALALTLAAFRYGSESAKRIDAEDALDTGTSG
ncbi:hypothetical protein [Streptomyces sp. NPDC047939]|uniref:hypothetical protein n=1 Tax=Streptomyces sp. NPDC047939 TaxID=3155381 RepID=UPI003423B99D